MGLCMPSKPSVEARLLLDDPRWPTYRDGLQELLDARVASLLKATNSRDHVRMVRLAGEASAFKRALGLPAELEKTDPKPSSPGDDA